MYNIFAQHRRELIYTGSVSARAVISIFSAVCYEKEL